MRLVSANRRVRVLRDQSTCGKIRGADNTEAIYALLCDASISSAA